MGDLVRGIKNTRYTWTTVPIKAANIETMAIQQTVEDSTVQDRGMY